MDNNTKLQHFFNKHGILPSNIKYILREEGKSCIHLVDDRVVSSFHTLKSLEDFLPDGSFCMINKGILLSKSQIVSVDKNSYQMLDGRTFEGRKRGLKIHQTISDSLSRNINLPVEGIDDIVPAFSVLNQMPVAFCVIQLIFDKDGRGIDFIFRYCNRAMEDLEGKTLDEMMNRSFHDIFPNADPKWLVSYANVALNGVSCSISDYSPEVDRNLTIHCFQPMEGFCACLLLEE